MKAVVEICLVQISLTIWILFCLSLAHIVEIRMNSVNFISRRKLIFLFFEKAGRILSLCEFSWSFRLQSWCTGSILFKEANFSPHQWRQLLELALVLLLLTIWVFSWLFGLNLKRQLLEFSACAIFVDHLNCRLRPPIFKCICSTKTDK